MNEPSLIPASTILLVRDATALEVLMVVRHHQIEFASGALVFTGGKLSRDDEDSRWLELGDEGGPIDVLERARRVAAIREAFEESGILLARSRNRRGPGAPFAAADDIAPLAPLRAAIDRGEASFCDAIARAGLVLALDALTPFAHWITPVGMPKRFDTWFYIAATPAEQAAACDGREAVSADWIAPAAALADAQAGRSKIMFPTRLNLERLSAADTVEAALRQTLSRPIVTVEPRVERTHDGLFLLIPAEAGYSITREPLTNPLG